MRQIDVRSLSDPHPVFSGEDLEAGKDGVPDGVEVGARVYIRLSDVVEELTWMSDSFQIGVG